MLNSFQVLTPHILVGNALELGATVTPNFKGLFGTQGVFNRFPFSFLKDSNVSLGALLLPTPALTTTIVKSYRPVAHAEPFQVATTCTVQRSLAECPPSFRVQATKHIAERKIAVFTWESGIMQWPDFLLKSFPSLGMSTEGYYASMQEAGSLQMALMALPKPAVYDSVDDKNEYQEDEMRRIFSDKPSSDRVAESWSTFLTLAPGGGGIGLSYSRNIFSGKPTDDPVMTEWSSEGYFPMAKMDEPRGVRVQVDSVIGLDGSLNWTVKGTRRIGENTKIGIGMGIATNHVVMTVSWKRLGQRINLPVVLLPHSHHGAAILTTIFPWLAYCGIEFGYVRPRNRKKRRQAVARRHKELNKLIPRKRAESEQAIELMLDQVQRRQSREESHDGLVITKAEYGYYPSQNKKPKSGFTEPRVIDVTIPVAALVDRGQLVIPKNQAKVSQSSNIHSIFSLTMMT